MSASPTLADVEAILADPAGRPHSELRDRAAFVFVTGSYPSHLRQATSRMLTLMLDLEGQGEPEVRLDPDIAARLELETHPMVVKVLQHRRSGYLIRSSRGPNERRPYGKVFVFKDAVRKTIKVDGSVKEGWA